MKIVLIATLFMFAAGLGVAQQPAPVGVEHGLVQGTSEDGLTVYRGIPFAAPPVGDLRWRAPQPAAKWVGMRQATKFGPSPIQGTRNGPGMSEDCMYLNVWIPAKSTNDHIPVLVWIYGGGFSAGATSDPNYSGEKLAKKGVVLVSIAYRVGQLGFLAHPQLCAETTNHVSGKAYVLKENAANEIVSALEKVDAGEAFVSTLMLEAGQRRSERVRELLLSKPQIESLTPVERRILKLIGEDYTSKEIADRLKLSVRTVDNHRQHICNKLQLHGTHSLLKFAFDNSAYL